MADAKIINYGQQISAGSTAIPDNTSVALDIESTDAKDYVTISTDDSNPSIILGKDGAEVGIGVASPAHLLHVQDGDAAVVTNSADAVAKSLVFTKSRNATDGAHTPVADNDVIGTIQFKASNGAAFSDVASIRAQIDGEPGAAASISSISAAGAGYTATGGGSASATSTTSGVGSGLTVSITVGGSGEITGASVVSAGTRYVTGETVTVTGGSSAATLVVTSDTSDMPSSLRFATSADGGATLIDRFVIRQGGNVGIGDTEPNYHCVIGSGKSGAIAYVYNSNTSEPSSGITAHPNGATGMIIDHRASDSLYLMNTTKGNTADVRNTGIAFFGRTDEASDEYPMMGAIRVKHEGTAADQKGYMTFYTNDGDDDRAPQERMRITSEGDVKFSSATLPNANYYPMIQASGGGPGAGNVSYSFINDSDTGFTSGGGSNTCGIATLGTYRMFFAADGKVGMGLTNPAHVLDVVGTAGLSTGTAWTNTSDSRIKTDVQSIENAMDKISQLRPVSFNYTEDYLSVHPEIDGSKRYNSFVAQEYAEVFPDAVTSTATLERIITPESEGVKEVRETLLENVHQYTPHDLTMYLVKAVQELSAKVTALEEAQGN